MIRKLNYFIPFLLLCSWVFTSCKHEEKELATLDSMQLFLVKADSIRKTVDHAKLDAAIQQINNNLLAVQNKLGGDTLPEKSAVLLENYRNLGAALKNYSEELKKTEAELEETRKQLSDLRHDVEHELLDEKKTEEYVEQEVAATMLVCNKVTMLSQAIGMSYLDQASLEESIKPMLEDK